MTLNPRDEIVTIVDEHNRETGTAPRHLMRSRNLIHRAAYILVFNSREEVFVQKRTPTKDVYPGYYDVAAGGVVLAGESYEHSAARELAEELGIRGVALAPRGDFYHEEAGQNRVWGRVFSCVYDGPLTLQEDEIESGRFMDAQEVLGLADREPFTPDGLYALHLTLNSPPES